MKSVNKSLQVGLACLVLAFLFQISLWGPSSFLSLDPGDDLQNLALASHFEWNQILKALAWPELHNPLAYSNWPDRLLTNRLGQTILLKILYGMFGSAPLPYFAFQASLAALCAALLSVIVLRLTKSTVAAVGAAVFYTAYPPAVYHNLWLSDFAEWILFSTLLIFALFLRFLRERKLPQGLWIAIGIVAYFAFRTLPSAYIILLMSFPTFAFHFIARSRARTEGEESKLAIWVFGGFTALTLAAIAISGGTFERFATMVWMNPRHEFGGENVPGWFDPSFLVPGVYGIIPGSIMRSVHLLFGWMLMICLLFAIQRRMWKRIRVESVFVCSWLVIQWACYSQQQNSPRYLSYGILPLILAASILWVAVWRELLHDKWKRAFVAILTAAAVYQGINNVMHVGFVRDFKFKYFHSMLSPASVIYADFHGNASRPSAEEITWFLWPSEVRQIRQMEPAFLSGWDRTSRPHLKDLLAFSSMPVMKANPEAAKPSLDTALNRYGRLYGVSHGHDPEPLLVGMGFEAIATLPYTPPLAWSTYVRNAQDARKIVVYRKVLNS